MQFNEVHILFEQSGTFKKVFADKKYTGLDRSRISPEFAKNFVEFFLEE